MGKLRLPSHATVVAYLALVAALGLGTAWAATELEKNEVKSKHLKNRGVKTKDLANNAVTSPKVANGSLLSEDFGAGQLPQGPQGPQGEQGPAGRSALSTLQTGESVRGVIGSAGHAGVANQPHRAFESLPVPAPVALDDAHINVDVTDDPGDVCGGTYTDPTAPQGFVCIYLHGSANAADITGNAPGSDPSRFGFTLRWKPPATGDTNVQASWAYTAP